MTAVKVAESLGRMFYPVSPKATTFATLDEVPMYVGEATPWLLIFALLELLYHAVKDRGVGLTRHTGSYGQAKYRMNDTIASLGLGAIQQMARFIFGSLQMVTYNYIWDNYKIETVAFDEFKVSTWFGCFLATEFAYYWIHRAAHEINILWAGHSVHHSSEIYNIAAGFRQSLIQTYSFTFLFNLPLAFVFSPAQYLVHSQFNLLFQVWLHTGRNIYCIDKNYGGTLIIWDRMFGTYASERIYPDVVATRDEEEPISYGLTHPVNTFDPISIQFGHLVHIYKTVLITPGFADKLKVVFYGPGWHPGVPRMGLLEEIPDIDVKNPPIKYDPKLPMLFNCYVALQALIASAMGTSLLAGGYQVLPQWQTQALVVNTVVSFTTIGKIMDAKPNGLRLELVRTLASFFIAEFVARSGYWEQSYWQRRGTLALADTFLLSSVFLGRCIYKYGNNWTSLTPAVVKKDKVKTH
ncbi:hypothetical protein BGZ74_011419 [Mortierella antarctica]|nr:hypothetical protein BGZ74_011419 [Mortierella antarctica]